MNCELFSKIGDGRVAFTSPLV